MTVLLTTLGMSWGVIPEAFAVAAPEHCPLYHQQPAVAAARPADWPALSALWVCTTTATLEPLNQLMAWWTALDPPLDLRVFIAQTHDTSAQYEVELLRELIWRATCAAGPDAILSLAGGRKTMSADLQQAGAVFGCHALIHVLPPEPLPAILKSASFLEPLPADCPIQPVFLPGRQRAMHLDLMPAIRASDYPLPTPSQPWQGPAQGQWLWRRVMQRESQAGNLLVQAHHELAQEEKLANWRGLYRLPPQRIRALREQRICVDDAELLIKLPKAELHCHIGGILDLAAQMQVGRAVWTALPQQRRDHATTFTKALDWSDPWQACAQLKQCPDRAAAVACCLASPESTPVLWQQRLFAPTEPRVGLKGMPGDAPGHPQAFAAYELPGELSGSALLIEPLALEPYIQAILESARAQGLRYLELRGSPSKYRPRHPLSWLQDFYDILKRLRQPQDPELRFIVIADWRAGEQAPQVIATAVSAREQLGSFIAGIDLAGDESAADIPTFAEHLERAFAMCLPITIHAGEGTPADAIWKATYRLHADRIGHGLTLADHPDLARRFRDRRICVELCPSSNREVVGYADPLYPGSQRHYPLNDLLALGVPCTICTDNPGISRTTLAGEYLAAARMAPDGLSWWHALGLMRQAFTHAFCETDLRDRLLVSSDAAVCQLITEYHP